MIKILYIALNFWTFYPPPTTTKKKKKKLAKGIVEYG